MKLIMFLLFSNIASATNYYVSNSGSDAANGTTTGTSWQTISKVNLTATTNDSVFFKRGDSWNERLLPASATIYYGAYGTGAKPLITALQTFTGFANQGGNIWTKTISSAPGGLNTVIIDGAIRAKGRYPNSGYLTFKAQTTLSRVVGTLTGFPDYTGAEIVVRGAMWVLDVRRITSQVADTFFISPNLSYAGYAGANGYFIQNSTLVLDQPYEWAFNSTTKVLTVYSTTSPSVQVPIFDTLVNISRKNNVTIDGLKIEGANTSNINIDTSDNFTLKNSLINFCGYYSVAGRKSNYVTIKKDSILNSNSSSIYLFANTFTGCNNSVTDSNYIKNCQTLPGMGQGYDNHGETVNIMGLDTYIAHNVIDSSGYNGIHFQGKRAIIKNNVISNFCVIKLDGGGVYTSIGTYYAADFNDSSIVRGNIIYNGGFDDTQPSVGVYADNNARRITVDSNTIFNTKYGGIYLNNATQIWMLNNTISNTSNGCVVIANVTANNNTVKHNILYSSSTYLIHRVTFSDVTGNTIDSNYLVNPNATKFRVASTLYSLAGWRAATGYDTHSDTTLPATVISNVPSLVYNPTGRDSTFSFGSGYTDLFNNLYYGAAVISAYSSKLLFPCNLFYIKRVGAFKFSSQ